MAKDATSPIYAFPPMPVIKRLMVVVVMSLNVQHHICKGKGIKSDCDVGGGGGGGGGGRTWISEMELASNMHKLRREIAGRRKC